MLRSATMCGESLRPLEDKEESQCRTCARIATVSLWKTTFGGLVGRKSTKWWCATCGTGGNRTSFWSCKTRESFEQAKVFKAQAVPQGLCANLINALKLLANQQEDGDGLPQIIVTNLGMGSRKDLTDGLRQFIKVDNERALDVGELRRGTGTLKVRKPQALERGSDLTIRESPDEWTSWAEDVNTWKALIDVKHNKPERLALSWLTRTGMPSARRCTVQRHRRRRLGRNV